MSEFPIAGLFRAIPRFACLLVFALASRAADYHVDARSGNDAMDARSPATAWRSFAPLHAMGLQPGDRILLRSGSRWTNSLNPRGSGTPGCPIELNRYGDGPLPEIAAGGREGGALQLTDQQHWRIRNLALSNRGGPAAKKMGLLVRNRAAGTLADIEVSGCEVREVEGELRDYRDGKESGGIVFLISARPGAEPSCWKDVRIVGNHLHDLGRNGILMASQWINKPGVTNSSWGGHGLYTTSTGIHIVSNRLERIAGDGILLWCAKGAVVEHNVVVAANDNAVRQGHAAVWPYFCEDVVLQFNEVSGTRTTYDGMAFDFDNGNQRCVYQYNYSHDNEGGFLNMCCDGDANGNIARFNVSVNDGCAPRSRVFLVHGHGNHGYQIYHNTVVAGRGDPVIFLQGGASDGSSIRFRNNLIVNTGTGTFGRVAGCTFEQTLYAGPDQPPAGLLRADPGFASLATVEASQPSSLTGLRLRANSAAIGVGLPVKDPDGRDFEGRVLPSGRAPDLGAFSARP